MNLPIKKFNKIKPINALKHPSWKMGSKITVDSSTLMNKVFEVIEAYKLFSFNKKTSHMKKILLLLFCFPFF